MAQQEKKLWQRCLIYDLRGNNAIERVSTYKILGVFIDSDLKWNSHVQLFRERSSENVYATIPKGNLGGFEFAVLQRNLREWHKRPWAYVCAC